MSKETDWQGLHDAIRDAYPDNPEMADSVCSGEPDSVYRFIFQILCANKRRGQRITDLMNAIDDLKSMLYKINSWSEDAMEQATEAIEKVGAISAAEVVE